MKQDHIASSEEQTAIERPLFWMATREGMSCTYTEAALLDNGEVCLISAGMKRRNNMPPGFIRFLSEDEKRERGYSLFSDGSGSNKQLLRMGRKHSPANESKAEVKTQRAAPYYRQFDKRTY